MKSSAARKPPAPDPAARSKKSEMRAEVIPDCFRSEASSRERHAAARIASPVASMERIRTLPAFGGFAGVVGGEGEKRNLLSRMEKIS